jgi:iron complex transport system substrate-binding protein
LVRIVSLLPSTTEILFAIGAGADVVGVTFECNYPPEARARRIVSATTMPDGLTPGQIDAEVKARLADGQDLYRLDAGALRELDPDLVVTQDLCAVCAVEVARIDQALDYLGCRAEVVTVDPSSLAEVLDSIGLLGRVTGTVVAAEALLTTLSRRLDRVREAVAGRARRRLVVLEWTDPLFSAGHWIPDMVEEAGALSVLGASGERSRQIEAAAVAQAEPDIIVVAPCGYRLDRATELAVDLVRAGRLPASAEVWAVDADAAFVRPGPRLVDGVEALAAIAHPGAMPARADLTATVRRG